MTASTTVTADSKMERRLSSLTTQEPAQSHVRRRLGLSEHDPAALTRVAECYDPPEWAVGSISFHDAMFLYDFVRGLKPRRVIEIGVASGGSTAFLLMALADAGVPMLDERGEPTLQSFDLHPWCYFDYAKPVGSAVLEMAKHLWKGLRLRTGCTAVDAGRIWAHEPVELAFVDADHRHPGTTADVLGLMPALAPGAWVVLHDIRLPEAARREEERIGKQVDWREQHGAEWLFEAWPREKICGGTVNTGMGGTNIGAIRMPLAHEAPVTAADLRELIARPAEVALRPEVRAVLGLG